MRHLNIEKIINPDEMYEIRKNASDILGKDQTTSKFSYDAMKFIKFRSYHQNKHNLEIAVSCNGENFMMLHIKRTKMDSGY